MYAVTTKSVSHASHQKLRRSWANKREIVRTVLVLVLVLVAMAVLVHVLSAVDGCWNCLRNCASCSFCSSETSKSASSGGGGGSGGGDIGTTPLNEFNVRREADVGDC